MKYRRVTDDVVMQKAKDYALQLGFPNFKGSGKWLRYFKKRHRTNQKVLHSAAGSADMVHVYIAQAQSGLPALLKDVSPYDIYNMDETGLNYRTLPK